jgi:DNA polymerase III delta prime subunit
LNIKLNELIQALEDSFNRWEYLKEHGGSDPFWEDGCNMNLVRNHIFHFKSEIQEICEQEGLELPEIYYLEAPLEMDSKYMARADEIRQNARVALDKYKANEDYLYLLNAVNKLNKMQIERTSINNVIGYCKGLETFIETDDLVSMRRHEKYERYLESFCECHKKVEDILKEPPKVGQMSIFEMEVSE